MFARDQRSPPCGQMNRVGARSCHFGVKGFENGVSRRALGPLRVDLLMNRRYHAENPDFQGVGREHLRPTLQPKLPKPAFDAALKKLAGSGRMVLDGAFVRLPSHEIRLSPEDLAAWAYRAPARGAQRFRPPRVRDIAAATGRSEGDVRRDLKRAGRMGWADQVAHDHFFLRSTVREMAAIVRT